MESFKFEEDAHGGAYYLYEEGAKIGEVTFRKQGGNNISINHTYVKTQFEGKGYGKKLVDKVIEHAQTNDLNLSATCWFAVKVMESHA